MKRKKNKIFFFFLIIGIFFIPSYSVGLHEECLFAVDTVVEQEPLLDEELHHRGSDVSLEL